MGFCLFFHKWGPWELEKPLSSCNVKRQCLRCKKTEFRNDPHLLRHKWGDWELQEPFGSCKEKRKCLRCGWEDSREEHRWGEWAEFRICYRKRICERCGKTEEEDLHTYPATTQTCDLCGKQFDPFMNA